uniref:Ribosomal protein L14 n=1 Tax=Rhizaria sp. TaxID=2204297 RepID=A0A5P8DJR9_9EUKA|nr:ribosomal protein L14 [Rhizaria sp.]
MIHVGSQLKVVDNSGANWSKCISIKKKGKHPFATVGMFILITLKNFSNRKKVNKRLIYIGLIVGISFWICRVDGTFVKFFSNFLLLFNKQFKFLGTRVYGCVLKEIKITSLQEKKNTKYFQKIFSYSSSFI